MAPEEMGKRPCVEEGDSSSSSGLAGRQGAMRFSAKEPGVLVYWVTSGKLPPFVGFQFRHK